ncbi:hypothetical protein [Salinispora pacifica]|uniref:hypothetical protein n=1 Tax=Salinispora pacifica TaxID=351187 RepID=UPI00037C7A1C|nr:hypothetical protein [Salinispora pacifica]
MDSAVQVALISAGSAIGGGGLVIPVVAHFLGRQTRAAQQRLADAQAEQAQATTGQIRQDIYQELTMDLRSELQQVRSALRHARKSLAATSAEAERLRLRVVGLESRIAQLELTEQQLSAELRAAQAERDQLRGQPADGEATISALTCQINDLEAQLAGLQVTPETSRLGIADS